MATNAVQDGKVLDIQISDVKSGEPVNIGHIVGVALTNTDSDGFVRIQTYGVWSLPVSGSDGTNNKAIGIGDYVYIDNKTLNADSSKTLFGIALQPVDAGATATIEVMLI